MVQQLSSHMEGMVPHLARCCKSGANNCVLGQFLYEVHVVSWIRFPSYHITVAFPKLFLPCSSMRTRHVNGTQGLIPVIAEWLHFWLGLTFIEV